MTEATNGRPRFSAGERTAGEFPHSLPGVRTEVVIFDNSEQMVQSLGSHDEALRFIEEQFPAVDFHVRGNELAISGPAADVPRIMRLLHEVRGLVDRGTVITPAVLQQLAALLRSQSLQNPVEVLTHNILSSRGKTIRPKTLNQKNYVDAIDANTVIFGIGPAGTGKTFLAMAKAVQALQQKEVSRIILDAARSRGRGTARLPAGHPQRQDRPVPAAALRRPPRHDGSRVHSPADGGGHHRGGSAGLHARPDPERRVHHPRRGPEHHPRADEDVPHAPRIRLQNGGHR